MCKKRKVVRKNKIENFSFSLNNIQQLKAVKKENYEWRRENCKDENGTEGKKSILENRIKIIKKD